MMGRRESGQGQFFYAFDLNKVVPPDHLVRLAYPGVVEIESSAGHAERLITRSMDRAGRG